MVSYQRRNRSTPSGRRLLQELTGTEALSTHVNPADLNLSRYDLR